MKTCFKCGLLLPLSDFYKHGMMADGHLNKCKECTKKDVNKHRADNLEKVRKYDRDRAKLEHRKQAYKERTKARRAADKRYQNCHNAVRRAIKNGLIERKDCEWCGRVDNVFAHHEDYDKPLDVMWLCPPCHAKRHQQLQQQGKEVW